jgi:pimeloyl-ACP methyl ester carboxylesterase
MKTLLLHGALGAKTQLHPLKELLSNDREVYSMNFSGHGGEPFSNAGFGIEVFADDVRAFMDAHSLDRVDIFGYSMGGYVALWFAWLYPQRVNSIVTLGTKFDWDVSSAEKEARKVNPEKILEKIPAFARILEHRHAPNDWKELLRKTGDMMLGLGRQPLLTEEIIRAIAIPTQVVLGDLDDMADRAYSERVAGLLPGGSFLSLENTPHPIEKLKWVPFV